MTAFSRRPYRSVGYPPRPSDQPIPPAPPRPSDPSGQAPDYLAQIAQNTTQANELLEEIHQAIELSGAPRVGSEGSDDPTRVVTLSYLLEQQQLGHYHQAIGAAMKTLFGYIFISSQVINWDNHHWLKDKMHLEATVTGGFGTGTRCTIDYTYNGIDPDASAFAIGDEKRLSEEPYEQRGAGYIIDLSNDDQPLAFEREETVTLDQSSSLQMTHTTEMDLGTEAEFGGSIPGTGFEAKVRQTFNYKDANEEQKAKAQSQGHSVSAKIALEAEPHRVTRVGVISNAVHSNTPKGWHGVVDFGITFKAPLTGGDAIWRVRNSSPIGPDMAHGERYREADGMAIWSWPNTNEFLAFLDGADTELRALLDRGVETWPEATWWYDYPILPKWLVAARETIRNGAMSRHLDLDGIDVRDYKEGANIEVDDITGQDIDAVAQAHGIPENHIISPHPQRGAAELIDRMGNSVLYLGSCGQYHRTPPATKPSPSPMQLEHCECLCGCRADLGPDFVFKIPVCGSCSMNIHLSQQGSGMR